MAVTKAEVVIGVDPDSEKHGVAIYRLGKLITLAKWSITDFLQQLEGATDTIVSIENVMANQFVYKRNEKKSKTVQSKVAMHIGRCQQAQVELMRLLDHLNIPYQLISPMKGNWADNKAQFERVTGWTGTSNQDTRSAAFFGYLAVR